MAKSGIRAMSCHTPSSMPPEPTFVTRRMRSGPPSANTSATTVAATRAMMIALSLVVASTVVSKRPNPSSSRARRYR